MKILFLCLFLWINPLTFVAEMNATREELVLIFQKQQYDIAEKKLNTLLKDYKSETTEIYLNLAHIYFLKKNKEKAILYYDKVLQQQNPMMQSVAFNQLGYMSAIRQNLPEALQFFKEAIIRYPKNEEARYNYELVLKKVAKNPQIMQLVAKNNAPNSDTLSKISRPNANVQGNEQGEKASPQGTRFSEKGESKKNLLSKEKAENILQTLRNQETQYLQQKQKSNPKINPNHVGLPEW